MAIIAHSAEERAQQLLALTVRLNARLSAECAAYEAHRPQDIYDQIEETRALSSLYSLETTRIKANPKLIAGISVPLKEQLKAETLKFQDIMARYTPLVSAAKAISEGIMNAVVAEMQKSNPQPTGYGPKGSQAKNGLNSLSYGARV
jgi:hypothetical protein